MSLLDPITFISTATPTGVCGNEIKKKNKYNEENPRSTHNCYTWKYLNYCTSDEDRGKTYINEENVLTKYSWREWMYINCYQACFDYTPQLGKNE